MYDRVHNQCSIWGATRIHPKMANMDILADLWHLKMVTMDFPCQKTLG